MRVRGLDVDCWDHGACLLCYVYLLWHVQMFRGGLECFYCIVCGLMGRNGVFDGFHVWE